MKSGELEGQCCRRDGMGNAANAISYAPCWNPIDGKIRREANSNLRESHFRSGGCAMDYARARGQKSGEFFFFVLLFSS